MKATPKVFSISKQTIYASYERVKQSSGGAGCDGQTIEAFEKHLKSNLYKIWNRMSSGSYHPPRVKQVEIPKANGKKRKLGIPTVSDRIAQMAVKMTMEPELEKVFVEDSYGYRPNKSAIQAVSKARERSWEYDWVIDLDIENFFDSIDHDLMMKALERHCKKRWVLLYVKRWLQADVETREGIEKRDKGTPQGGVVSPLLANLFLHYALDKWLQRNYPRNPYERYADDCIIHCKTEEEAQKILQELKVRMAECKLQLHQEKTKIVYCKDHKRRGTYPHYKFDFLGYTFRPRLSRNRKGWMYVGFTPAISQASMKRINAEIRSWDMQRWVSYTLEEIGKWINPKVRGWINYYGHYNKSSMNRILYYLDHRLLKWIKRKYKVISKRKTMATLQRFKENNRNMFAHWKIYMSPIPE